MSREKFDEEGYRPSSHRGRIDGRAIPGFGGQRVSNPRFHDHQHQILRD